MQRVEIGHRVSLNKNTKSVIALSSWPLGKWGTFDGIVQKLLAQGRDRVFRERPLLLLGSLFFAELSILIMAVAIYVRGDRPVAIFLSSQSGRVLLMALATFGMAGTAIICQYIASCRVRSRRFRLTVAMNLIMVLVILLTSEMVARLCVSYTGVGERWRGVELLPKSWETFALFRRKLLESGWHKRLSYQTYDDVMGWTTGRNRKSLDGLYYSSSEGIRASHAGVSFAKSTHQTRIALVGDSFTFGDDVAYEDSWGYHLEKALGSEFAVLNFGVGGYGVDQAYLRYEKDVRQWKPKVVIFGFISDDVKRTMKLYHSITTRESGWPNFPFAKPRFILRDEVLKLLNQPPLTPEALYARKSISELPFVEYDRGYWSRDWQFSVIHHSYLARIVMTLFPRWETFAPDVSDAALVSVNASIVKAFIQSATSEGSLPLVVYFPETNAELDGQTRPLPVGRQVLQAAGIPYTDLTPCLRRLSPTERFDASPPFHYSPQGNTMVAQCLVPVVQDALKRSRQFL